MMIKLVAEEFVLQEHDNHQLMDALVWHLWRTNNYSLSYDIYRDKAPHTNVYKYLSSHLKQ